MPTKPGWYWWKMEEAGKFEPVRIFGSESEFMALIGSGRVRRVQVIRGIFGPRLIEPATPQETQEPQE